MPADFESELFGEMREDLKGVLECVQAIHIRLAKTPTAEEHESLKARVTVVETIQRVSGIVGLAIIPVILTGIGAAVWQTFAN